MNIYQGEPLGLTLTVKDGDTYLTDLSSINFEALMKDSFNDTVHQWSKDGGTITYSSFVKQGVTIGCATFSLTGTQTAELQGTYTLEVAKVLSSTGRAIGILSQIVEILPANIRRGVQ